MSRCQILGIRFFGSPALAETMINVTLCGVTPVSWLSLFGQGWRGVACCRAALLCLRAAFHVYLRCFSTPPPIGHACYAASHCGDLGAWPRTKGECRVCASASQQRPEVHRRAHLVGHGARWTGDLPMRTAYRKDCAARETCTQPPYRCSPGMSLTCEQTGHTGALCVC